MAVSVKYDADFASYSITSYLKEWATNFGNLNHTSGHVNGSNTGGFNPGPFDGTQYSITSTQNNVTAVVANGNLHYTMFQAPQHTLWGQLDSLNFGEGVQKAANGSYVLTSPEVSFSGLNLSSLKDAGNQGVVHKIVYGLMSGNVNPLLDALKASGVDVTTDFAHLNNAHSLDQAHSLSVAASAAVDVVGVHDAPELHLAA